MLGARWKHSLSRGYQKRSHPPVPRSLENSRKQRLRSLVEGIRDGILVHGAPGTFFVGEVRTRNLGKCRTRTFFRGRSPPSSPTSPPACWRYGGGEASGRGAAVAAGKEPRRLWLILPAFESSAFRCVLRDKESTVNEKCKQKTCGGTCSRNDRR